MQVVLLVLAWYPEPLVSKIHLFMDHCLSHVSKASKWVLAAGFPCIVTRLDCRLSRAPFWRVASDGTMFSAVTAVSSSARPLTLPTIWFLIFPSESV